MSCIGSNAICASNEVRSSLWRRMRICRELPVARGRSDSAHRQTDCGFVLLIEECAAILNRSRYAEMIHLHREFTSCTRSLYSTSMEMYYTFGVALCLIRFLLCCTSGSCKHMNSSEILCRTPFEVHSVIWENFL